MVIGKASSAGLVIGTGIILAVGVWPHEKREHTHLSGTPAHGHSEAPPRMTMEELHEHGGIPPGWKFTLPEGDPEAGREAYIAMKCYTCHAVAGEQFPAHKRDIGDVGPDLTGMGEHHPPEYFAEAIVNPNAVVLLGEGYTGPGGLSRMPEFNGTLTVEQLIDLVAYLKSLIPEGLYQGIGVVITSEPRKGRIVVDHEAIEGFMEAMTMRFAVLPPTLLQGVKPGDKIRFTIDADRRAVVEITPVRE